MQRFRREPEPGVTIVVPCFNEEESVAATVEQVSRALDAIELAGEMIFVNDGSHDATLSILEGEQVKNERLRVFSHGLNRGYGAALKTGIEDARYDRIVITDADGTYPSDRIPELVQLLEEGDMAVGARIGQTGSDSWIRTLMKRLLLQFGRALSGADILDINSGLRAMRVRWVRQFWFMLPDGFSFTTTITLAMHMSSLRVLYMPIQYGKRVGKSSIRPVRDTLRIFSQVFRTVAYFKAFQVFSVLATGLIVAGAFVGLGTKWIYGEVAQVPTMALVVTGMLFFGLGLVGDLVNARRSM